MNGRRGQIGRASTSVLLAALLASCSINPVSRRPEVSLISSAREAELGAEAAKQVEAQMGLVEDRRTLPYVQELGARIAEASPRQDVDYEFHIVDIAEPNAFALPGGYVYVSRGLLANANSEAEVANVLGHEIAHVAARHASQRVTRAVGVGVVLLPAAIVGGTLGFLLGTPGDVVGATVNAPLQILGVGAIAAYSRGQEREADEVGQGLVAEEGIDPHGMPQFMRTLTAWEELRTEGEARHPGFFDTHPTTPSRVTDTERRAESLEWTPKPGVAADEADFLSRLENLLVGDNPAEGIFRDELFLHPDLAFVVRFPDDWKTVNAKAGVGAFPEDKDARIVLELHPGEETDPREAADTTLRELSKKVNVRVADSGDLRIGGFPAFRMELVASRGGDSVPLLLTWISKDGLVYRFTAASTADRFPQYRATFDSTIRSFREIRPSERASIEELRLRVVKANAGESLDQLSRRTGNGWELGDLAVANALAKDVRLKAGQRVKVAVPRPYQSKPVKAPVREP